MGGGDFLETISLERVVVPFPKIVIILPRTYEKLTCKKEQYQLLARSFGTENSIIYKLAATPQMAFSNKNHV